jgi:RNA:NAD 2'-phosphotransferase (TPT1/KptA family)
MKIISKHITWLLRHNLTEHVDEAGWIPVSKLADICMQTDWINKMFSYSPDSPPREQFLQCLYDIVAADTKQRFELTGDRGESSEKIRCCQGHSMQKIQPEKLYAQLSLEQALQEESESELGGIVHATLKTKLESITQNGLKSMSRLNVHFATRKNLVRQGCNCWLRLNVREWYSNDKHLFRANNGVLLASQDVDFKFLSLTTTCFK